MKKIIATLLPVLLFINTLIAQEYFTIRQYDVDVKVNKDASLDITENIQVHFTENRHGIYRFIPFKYPLQSLSKGNDKASRQLESGGYAHTIVENIRVDGFEYSVSNDGDYKSVKIGSADKVVDGDQQYIIRYRILNAINFFDHHSELYFNIIGDRWNTTIDSVNFSVELPEGLPAVPDYFAATGPFGSKENNTLSTWNNNQILSGHSTQQLNNNEGLSLGISFPKDFLVKQDYRFLGFAWMLLPLCVFTGMFLIWRRWGKDEKITLQTEYYPPENVSPSVAGYIIDDKLDRRDLTALVPYWGAGGYLQVKETEKSSLFGIIKNKEYAFTKVKELPGTAMSFEKTLFNGIFASGSHVMLDDLKDVLYTTMAASRKELEAEVDRGAYYEKGSRGL
ncbi:MAG: DUF2207 domain-containing protein, partial [Panacibacter sp.]